MLGRRVVSDLNPELLDLPKAHRMQSRRTGPGDLVFGTAAGREKSRSSIARHVLKTALERANAKRTKAGRSPIALGHRSAALSLEVYSRVVVGSTKGLGESMAKLVRGPEWAQTGTNASEAEAAVDGADNAPVEEVAV